jgi:hypothetical protein
LWALLCDGGIHDDVFSDDYSLSDNFNDIFDAGAAGVGARRFRRSFMPFRSEKFMSKQVRA